VVKIDQFLTRKYRTMRPQGRLGRRSIKRLLQDGASFMPMWKNIAILIASWVVSVLAYLELFVKAR
jgi:hypothetical protein